MEQFPRPDRSGIERNFAKTEENEALDIGWCEGNLSDGRPYWAECWAEFGFTLVTIFFSARGLEACTDDDLQALMEGEKLVEYLRTPPAVEGMLYEGDAGHGMWSVNVVIGDETGLWARDILAFRPYPAPATETTGH